MAPQRKIIFPAVAGAAALVVVVLGISLRWPAGLTVGLVLVCCAVGVLAYVTSRPERREIAPLPPPIVEAALPPPPVQMMPLQGVNLASAWPDYEFLFDATVYWRLVDGRTPTPTRHVRPGAQAVAAIIERAAAEAADARPDMAVRFQHHLNHVLGEIRHDATGRVEVWADQVRITVPDEDVRRLQELATRRKNEARWEQERHFENDRREYLSEDVLRSTGSALVWWLAKHDLDVAKAAGLIETMTKLTSAAKDEPVLPAVGSDGAGQPVGLDLGRFTAARSPVELVTSLMEESKLPLDLRPRFADQVAKNIEHAGNQQVADQIRAHFSLLTEDDEPASADPDEDTWRGAHAWPEED